MSTPLLTGTQVAHLSTFGFFWSAPYSCADAAENFFFFFDKNSGEMFKASLPLLTGQMTLTTVPNIGQSRCMVAHPTDANRLIYFNAVDGVCSINVTTGEIIILQDATTFDALFSGTQLALAYLTRARIRGTKIMLQGESENTGSVWAYDADAGTAELLVKSNGFQRAADLGPNAATELMLTGYQDPDLILYSRSLLTDEILMIAGTGQSGSRVDGNALTTARFSQIDRMFRMADDLFYVIDGNVIRWVQGGQVGSYDAGVMNPDFLYTFLPNRNMIVTVEVQGVTVYS